MRLTRRALIGAATMTIGALCAQAPLQAQDFPNKPIKILVPYQPGGTTDITARLVGEELRKTFNQPVVVENKPGAFGILAIEEMAKSKPDGYTLMLGNVTTNGVTPVLHVKKMKIDYLKEVAILTRVGDVPSIGVGTKKNFEPNTMQEVLAYAKANPGKLRYGSTGPGNYVQIDTELIARKHGLTVVHVVGKGGAAEVLNDLINGDTQFAFLNAATATTHIRGGTLKPYVVAWPTRLAEHPTIPTMAELGMGEIGTIGWQAIYLPRATPRDIQVKLHKAIVDAVKGPAIQESYRKQSIMTTVHATLEEADAWMKKDQAEWKKNLDELKLDLGN